MLLLEVLRTCFMDILIKIHWIKINNLLQPVQSYRKIALPDWDWILVFLVTWPNILSSLADFQCVCRCVSGICRILLDFKCLFKVQIMSGTNILIFHFISISIRQRWDDVYDARVSSTRVVSEACWCLHATDSFVNIQVNIVLDYEWAVIQQWLVWKQWVWLLFCLVFKLSMWEFGLERCDCLVV